jgi:DNA-directed RNA polymerase II subunit RPB2
VWTVITSYFTEKGLVRQQLDSFNDFVTASIQDLIEESPPIEVKLTPKHIPGDEVQSDVRNYSVKA